MVKLIAAFVAVVAAGLAGALMQPQAGAQEPDKLPGDVTRAPVQLTPTSASGHYALLGAEERGTWQIIELEQHVILLNSANGQTYHLVSQGDNLKWKLIPRPQPPSRISGYIFPRIPAPPTPEQSDE